MANRHVRETKNYQQKKTRRKEIVKLRAQLIDWNAPKSKIQKINKTKIWFSEEINKIDKPGASTCSTQIHLPLTFLSTYSVTKNLCICSHIDTHMYINI